MAKDGSESDDLTSCVVLLFVQELNVVRNYTVFVKKIYTIKNLFLVSA